MRIYASFFLGLIVCLGAGGLSAAERTLSVEDIKDLFAGKTVEGVVARWGFSFRGYYAADGGFRGKSQHGHWKVTEDARHCVKYGNKDWSCGVLITTGDGNYKKMRIIDPASGEMKHLVTFEKFIEGNPYGM